MNIVEIKFQLGHESVETTMRYLDITTEDKAKALATLSSEEDRGVPKRWKPSGATLLELCGMSRK